MNKLTEIQSELKAPKSCYNSFGKYYYRSQEAILEAVKPLLQKHKCSLRITDEVKEVGGIIYIEATCIFSDGSESIEVKAQAGIDTNRKGMDLSQSFGSSSSYARKYALNGLFAIDDTKDDDHNNKHGKDDKEATKSNGQPVKKDKPESTTDKATVKQKTEILLLLNNKHITKTEKAAMMEVINDITQARANKAISNLKANIADRESIQKEELNSK